MQAVLIFLSFSILVLPPIINGLSCYECLSCEQPFNRSNMSITTATTSNSTQSCYKVITPLTISRGLVDNCFPVKTFTVNTWCCNTDLCNSAQLFYSFHLKMLNFICLIGYEMYRNLK